MIQNRSWYIVDGFYRAGDIDFIYLWQLYWAVTEEGEEDEYGNSKSFNKMPEQIKNDTLRLAKYLIGEQGDFEAYDIPDAPFNGGLEELNQKIESLYEQNLLHDFESTMFIGLRKLTPKKPSPTKIPNEIVILFQPINEPS